LNPNAIPKPVGVEKALIAWDNTGGGNGVISNAVFNNGGRIELQVYFDTNNLPLSSNTANPPVTFRGSEETFYGIGAIDAFTNLADVSGTVGLGTAVGATGATGIAWYYEKVGETIAGAGDVSEKLYLIDANDGGNSNTNAAGGLDWTVLAMIDLSNTLSGWHTLSISILPDGAGLATFNNQAFPFTTVPNFVGEFYVGYRENTQAGAVSVPSYLRPATFAVVPEPSVAGLLVMGVGLFGVSRRQRKS
jgi:hypothetical protein